MKKIKTIIALLLTICSLFSLFACDGFYTGEEEARELVIDEEYVSEYNDLELYIVRRSAPQRVGNTYVDGSDVYSTFKIGKIYNVPIYSDMTYNHDGRTESTYEWSTSAITADEYARMQSNTVEAAVSTTVSVSRESSTEISGKFEYGGLGISASSTTKSVFATALDSSVSYMTTDSFTQTVSDRVERAKTRTVTISKSSPAGFYRYTIFSNVDVYATLVANKDTGKIRFSYFAIPDPENTFDKFYYHNNPYNDTILAESELLNMTESDFEAFNLFDSYGAITVPHVSSRQVLSDPSDVKITDTGAYGLEQRSKQSLINLSEYSQYMTDDYIFTFEVSISYEAQKVLGKYINGYKEMHLYKSDPGQVNNSIDITNYTVVKNNYGHIISEQWTSDKGDDQTYYWDVSGKDCSELMCIRYDANGNDEDTWYRKAIIVHLSIKMNDKI